MATPPMERREVLLHELQHIVALIVGMRLHGTSWDIMRDIGVTMDLEEVGAVGATTHFRFEFGKVQPKHAESSILGAAAMAPAVIGAEREDRARYLKGGELAALERVPLCADDLYMAALLEPPRWLVARVAELTEWVVAGLTPFHLDRQLRLLEGLARRDGTWRLCDLPTPEMLDRILSTEQR